MISHKEGIASGIRATLAEPRAVARSGTKDSEICTICRDSSALQPSIRVWSLLRGWGKLCPVVRATSVSNDCGWFPPRGRLLHPSPDYTSKRGVVFNAIMSALVGRSDPTSCIPKAGGCGWSAELFDIWIMIRIFNHFSMEPKRYSALVMVKLAVGKYSSERERSEVKTSTQWVISFLVGASLVRS